MRFLEWLNVRLLAEVDAKLSPAQQATLNDIIAKTKAYGSTASGDIDNPKDAFDRRRRKLYDLGLVCYVGCGRQTMGGFTGGIGVIPTDMFNPALYTKLPLNWHSKSQGSNA